MSGLRGHLAGQAAEASVARHYQQGGFTVAARRWRGQAGEIDLITRQAGQVVFVEVKRAVTHDRARERLGGRQLRRIGHAAAEYLDRQSCGLETAVRFDLALVDSLGRVKIVENVMAA